MREHTQDVHSKRCSLKGRLWVWCNSTGSGAEGSLEMSEGQRCGGAAYQWSDKYYEIADREHFAVLVCTVPSLDLLLKSW